MNTRIKQLVILGIIAISGVFGIQFYLLSRTYSAEQRTFDHKTQLALYEVVKRIHNFNEDSYPASNPIQRLSASYYVVNISREINCEILEFFLKTELEKAGITTDFEYGIYNCEAGEMVYGNYISFTDPAPDYVSKDFPKYNDWVYYFGVNFPKRHWFIAEGMWLWVIFTFISLTVLAFFVYSIFIVLQQKRYSELQRDVMNNMTHQFKTPLSTSKLALEYLLENKDILQNNRIHKYCQTLQEQNERLNLYVDQILTVAQSERKSILLQKEAINIVDIIKDEIELFQIQSANAQINFHVEKEEVVLQLDPFHFTNMIHNLFDNAIKYSPEEKLIDINLQYTNGDISFSVHDQGLGIPPKEIKKVFHRFYRISTGDVHNVKGFGLGLYYVKQVCTLHHWKIKISSKPDSGTTVTIIIPAKYAINGSY